MPDLSQHWQLDPGVAFLNHGSFGACPTVVLEAQRRWRDEMERQPVAFLIGRVANLLEEARRPLAKLLLCAPEDLAFVPNATAGVNAVLRSLPFRPGDEILFTSHEYNAVRNIIHYTAERSGAVPVQVDVPFPLESSDQVVEGVLSGVTENTRLAVLDHVTSPTGVVFPIEGMVSELAAGGIDTLVDGAHAPGMVPVDLKGLGAAYYTGNCHKWLCSPKGAGFLWVRPDRQEGVVPTSVSHGYNDPRTEPSRFRLLFDWTGTADPSPYLSVPEAIGFLGSLYPGGWPELQEANRRLALAGRRILCEALAIEPPAPEMMIGSMAAVPLPDDESGTPRSLLEPDPLHDELLEGWGIEVPLFTWPAWPHRLVRISAQAYNRLDQYERLGEALTQLMVRNPPARDPSSGG